MCGIAVAAKKMTSATHRGLIEYAIGSSSFHGPIIIVVDDTIDQTRINPNSKPPVSNLMQIDVLVPTGEGAMAHEGKQPTKLR